MQTRGGPGFEACALVLLAVGLVLVGAEQDPNIFGRIHYARYAMEHGELTTRADPFSYTAPGHPWIDHEWGFNWIAFAVQSLGGWESIRALRVLLLVATVLLAAGAMLRKHRDTIVAPVALAIIATPLMSGFHGPRPQAISYVFFGFMLLCLLRSWERGPRWIALAVAPMPLWVNIHGAFLAGMLVFFAWGGVRGLMALRERDFSTAGLLVGCAVWCAVSTLLNPWGATFLPFLWETARMPRPDIWEWERPSLFSFVGLALLVNATLFLASAPSLHRARRWPDLVATACVLFAAARHQRHLAFAVLGVAAFCMPLLADRIAARLKTPEGRALVPIRWMLRAVAAAGTVLLLSQILRPATFDHYPRRALDAMREQGLSGNLLVEWDWAQFTLFFERERYKIAFDGRYETAYPQSAADPFFAWQTGRDVRTLALDPRTELMLVMRGTPRDQPTEGYEIAYEDEQAVVYRRVTP